MKNPGHFWVEINRHDKELERLVTERAPDLMASHGIATLTIAEMLTLVGDDAGAHPFRSSIGKALQCLPPSRDLAAQYPVG